MEQKARRWILASEETIKAMANYFGGKREGRMTRRKSGNAVWFLLAVTCLLMGCEREGESRSPQPDRYLTDVPSVVSKPVAPAIQHRSPIVTTARSQIGVTTMYDPAYVGLEYPGGDVPIDRGVCTDVVVRALRESHGMDLQKLIHEDMKDAFSRYPAIWGLKRPDRNIDHRRVPNMMTFFERMGFAVGISRDSENYLPGDLVTCTVGGRPHIMIVSDKKTGAGMPCIIHNIGRGTQEEDRLFSFPITGHYRISVKADPSR